MSSISIHPQFLPVLDPDFVPAVLWNRAYVALAEKDGRDVSLALMREDGTCFRWAGRLLPSTAEFAADTEKYVERLVKFLLWQKGGSRILIAGADDDVAMLEKAYASEGSRKFDREFIGTKIFGEPISVRSAALSELPAEQGEAMSLGRNLMLPLQLFTTLDAAECERRARYKLALPTPKPRISLIYDEPSKFYLALERWGYDIADGRAAIRAFQRRWRPRRIDGELDGEVGALLFELLLERDLGHARD